MINNQGRGNRDRQAKKKEVDYQEKTTISGRRKTKKDRKAGGSQPDAEVEADFEDDVMSEEGSADEKRVTGYS